MHRRESAEIQMHRREDIYCAQMLGARVSVFGVRSLDMFVESVVL